MKSLHHLSIVTAIFAACVWMMPLAHAQKPVKAGAGQVVIYRCTDAAGNVTDYSGKGSVWLLEGINAAMYAMMTVFIFIPAVVQNPNVTWKVRPEAKYILESETISLLSETKLECLLLFDYTLIPMINGTNMSPWPMWGILALMTAGIILRLVRMKKLTAAPKRPWEG